MNWITQLWVPVGGELDSTVVGTSFCVCVNWIAQVVAGKKQEEKEKKEKEKKTDKKLKCQFQQAAFSVMFSSVAVTGMFRLFPTYHLADSNYVHFWSALCKLLED